jgi:hypothetical protein
VLGVDQEDLKSGTRVTTVQLSQTLETGRQARRPRRTGPAWQGHRGTRPGGSPCRHPRRAIQAFFDALTAQERVKVVEESCGSPAAASTLPCAA